MSDERVSPIGYLSGDWVTHDRMRISVDDLGFRQAVTAVERLRTYAGKVFQPTAHLERWQDTIEYLAIERLESCDAIAQLIVELLERNAAYVQHHGDVGITIFATPGIVGEGSPTLGLHLNPLDHDRNRRRQTQGQPLVITTVCQPHDDTWSRTIKVRCRLHYYRADNIARSEDPEAVGLLVDDDGSITESSIANVAIVESGTIISPESDQILGGVTQQVAEKIADKNGIPWHRQRLTPDRVRGADEVLLMGTDTGIWFANRVDRHPIGNRRPGPIYQRLSTHPIWNS